MLTVLFTILLISFVFKMIAFAIKASWGILKIAFFIVFFPVVLSGVFLAGLTVVATVGLVIALLTSLLRPGLI